MKKIVLPIPLRCWLILFQLTFSISFAVAQSDGLPRGAYQMPYKRYEADLGSLGNGAALLPATFDQTKVQSEASDQKAVTLGATGAYVQWTATAAAGGLTIRVSMPDAASGGGQNGSLALYVNGTKRQDIAITSKWAWQYFTQNNGGDKVATNQPGTDFFPRMRFDDMHVKITGGINSGDVIKIQRDVADFTYTLDFIELEPVPNAITRPANSISPTDAPYNAVANDGVDDFPAFRDCILAASQQGKVMYIPAGRFHLSQRFRVYYSNVTVQGAGIWQTELWFTNANQGQGGVYGNGSNIHISDLYIGTDNTARTGDFRGLGNGWGTNSVLERLWVEHFEVGAWVANYEGGPVTDGLLISHCRFRNTYADGVNFAKGTSNSICEYTNMRNNGDDAMASWSSSDGSACTNNEFRYNTAEHVWRAAGVGFFGGGGHRAHHLIIKDGLETGLRVNSDFPGPEFSTTLQMEFSEITVIGCGTNANLWDNRYGAIDIFTRLYNIQNLRFKNVDLITSQKDAIFIYNVNSNYTITNLEFVNVTINGTGKDGNVNNYTTGTYDDYAGYGILTDGSVKGWASLTNLQITSAASTPAIFQENAANFELRTVGTVPVTGVSITPSSAVSITEGQTIQLTAALQPANATNANVTWTSSSTAVATVDATGKVTAKVPGTTTITVNTQDGNKTATKVITVTPAVNIVATDATAGEGGNPGVFTISTSATASNITVAYVISGNASSADYTASPALTGSVTLTPATPSVTITINPIDDSAFESSENLKLTIQAGAGYNLGGNTSATISIADNDNPPCTAPVIGLTTIAPVIDQTIDAAWNNVPAGSLTRVTLGSLPGDFAGSKWRAMYDATNLYVLVEVKDNNKFNDSGTSWWEDDVVEIFIDGDNSKGTSYDGANDFQLGFRYNDTNINFGGSSVTRSTGIVFAQQNVSGGYNIEVKIPWSTIGTTAAAGKQLGFEVEVDDDDNGGTRDSQVSAFATTSTAWSSPSVFGSVYLTSCGSQPVIAVTGVTVSPTTASINAGSTQQLTATIAPANATNQNVSWSTSNAAVATVNASGLVTAIANGTATITVTTQDGNKTATSAITVTTSTVAVTGVTVSPTTASINVGSTQQLTATVAPANASNKNVTWTSSNTAVASVNASGLVTAISSGTSTITVKTVDGNKTATSAITVTTPTGTITCLKTSNVITVNGSLTETGWNLSNTVAKTTVGSPNNTVTFGVMWDNTNLYVGAKVLDANLNSDSSDPWEDDAIEIYIDANNNKLGSYDGLDNQIIKNYNKSTVFTKLTLNGLQHAWAAISGGYSVEFAIPWSQLGITSPVQGTTIGFDLGYDDDDNGGSRDAQAVWKGTIDNYQSTAGFGSLVLNNVAAMRSIAGDDADHVVESEGPITYAPNPVIDNFTIDLHGNSFKTLTVYDAIGKPYHSEAINTNQSHINLNLGALNRGMYLIRLHGESQSRIIKIIKE